MHYIFISTYYIVIILYIHFEFHDFSWSFRNFRWWSLCCWSLAQTLPPRTVSWINMLSTRCETCETCDTGISHCVTSCPCHHVAVAQVMVWLHMAELPRWSHQRRLRCPSHTSHVLMLTSCMSFYFLCVLRCYNVLVFACCKKLPSTDQVHWNASGSHLALQEPP